MTTWTSTWELPRSAEEAGLEGYRVVDASGRRLGTATVMLRRGDELYLVVRSRRGLRAEYRAVPLGDVGFVDHERCTVGLALSSARLSESPVLSRKLAVDGGAAEAVRVAAVPAALPVSIAPVRRDGHLPAAAFTGALGLLALLAVMIFVAAPWDAWEFGLFGVAALLFGLTAALAYRDRAAAAR